MSNPLSTIPPRVRFWCYIVYAVSGPILAYAAAKGWAGDAEYALWAGLGGALGLTAASNTPRRRPRR